MARRNQNADVDVETAEVEDVQTEETAEGTEGTTTTPSKTKRGELPEGYVTPVGFAKIVNERELHRNRAGEVAEMRPQMVYSYIRNGGNNPFPVQTLEDSNGQTRQVVNIEEGIAWMEAKNERVANRQANAAQKRAAAEAKAAEKAAQAEEAEGDETAEEAE